MKGVARTVFEILSKIRKRMIFTFRAKSFDRSGEGTVKVKSFMMMHDIKDFRKLPK